MRCPKLGFWIIRVNVCYLYPKQGEEGETSSSPCLGGTPHFATFITGKTVPALDIGRFGGGRASA